MVKEHAEFYELMTPIWRGALRELKWEERIGNMINRLLNRLLL
jgi:hypothetical protein